MNDKQFELELEKFRTDREKMTEQREQWKQDFNLRNEQWKKDFDLKYKHWFFQRGIWILSLVVAVTAIITKYLLT